MARHGVTYAEISEAANQLLGQGRTPTIEQIRLILGTGSSTTIAAHLKTWKENQTRTSVSLLSAKENIPEELIAMVSGLWERIIDISDEKLKMITANYQSSLTEVQEALEKYRHNNQRWQHLYHQWNLEKDSLYDERNQREKEGQQLREEHGILKSQYDQAIQQLLDKQDYIYELQRLNQQSQQNHEHFRQTIQEQRQVEQAQFAEQKNFLQTERMKLNDEVIASKKEKEVLRTDYLRLEQNIVRLGNDKSIVESELLSCKDELLQCKNEKVAQQNSAEDRETQYRKVQQELERQALKQQSEIIILSQQLSSAQQTLNSSEAKYSQLQKDNLALIQEKAMLEGRIRQWEITGSLMPA